MFPIKIISGGQTGVDQAALAAARELGTETGGTAPSGWLTEEGPREELLKSFGLVECGEEGYAARTRANVRQSDGTLLIGQHETGGSALTFEIARELNRPVFHVAFPAQPSAGNVAEFRRWLERHGIRTLNVAGDRESESPGIGESTKAFLAQVFRQP